MSLAAPGSARASEWPAAVGLRPYTKIETAASGSHKKSMQTSVGSTSNYRMMSFLSEFFEVCQSSYFPGATAKILEADEGWS